MGDSELSSNTGFSSDANDKAITLDAEISAQDPHSDSIKGNLQDDRVDHISGYKLAVVVASVALSCFLMLLDNLIVSTAIPSITDTFHSLQDIGWYASAYQFGSAAPQLLTGKIYTLFDTKWTFLALFGTFELGSLLCGAAVSSSMLIVGRAIAGFGAAGIIVGALTIISSCVPKERRPALLSITMGFNQLGLVAGPVIGSVLTSFSNRRWCFYINLPVGAIAAVAIVLLRIPQQTAKSPARLVARQLHRDLDLIGFVLFAPAVLQLLLALQYGGNQFPWNSSRVIGLFSGSAANFIVWFFWNRHKGDGALLPHAMIGRTAVWASGVYQGLLMAAVYGGIYFLPIYFQAINDASPLLSGVYLLPTILPQLVTAASSGLIISKIGYVMPLGFFSSTVLSVASGLYSLLQPGSPKGEWIGFQVIDGIGSGAGLQVFAVNAIQAVTTGKELSSAMAFMVFAQSLGPAIALALYNVIFDASLRTQLAGRVPNVDAQAIIDAGATGYRSLVQPGDLNAVLKAYANSIHRVFFLVAALAASASIFVCGMGWHDVRKKGGPEDERKSTGARQHEMRVESTLAEKQKGLASET
ncbi:major facilitator superfamily domain-containing protein [Xylaria sp. FL0064]|nr:major facilitator superfamily domain-containing protein [Xylaria sp. FL0064]